MSSSGVVWMGNVKGPGCTLNTADLPWEVNSVSCGNSCVNIVTKERKVFVSSNIKDGLLKDWKQPPELSQYKVVDVASGLSHHVALTTDNRLVSWGMNDRGQLGRGNISTKKKKKKDGIYFGASLIPAFQAIPIQQVSCGNAHTLCLTDAGEVYSWGANDCNQLGVKETKTAASCSVPHQVKGLDHFNIAQISAGGHHSFALSVKGQVFCWGSNRFGQLGLEVGNSNRSNCYHVESPAACVQKAKTVCCGENHTAFLTLDGRVYTSGLGSSGQLGHSSTENEFLPRQIEELDIAPVSGIACGRDYTLVYCKQPSAIYCFGEQKKCLMNLPGQLDDPDIHCGKSFFFLSPKGDGNSKIGCPSLRLESLLEVIKGAGEETLKQIKAQLTRALSKASCANESFLLRHENQEDTESIESSCGLDLSTAYEFFKEVRKPRLYKTTEQALNTLLKDLSQTSYPSDSLRLLVLLPCCLYGNDRAVYCEDIVISLAKLIIGLEKESKITLGKWLKNIPATYFKACVQLFKRSLNKKMNSLKRIMNPSDLTKEQSAVVSCVEVLEILNEINKQRSGQISYKKFYLKDLMDMINIEEDFDKRLDTKKGTLSAFRFCKYPFLYNSASKHSLLRRQCEAMTPKSFDFFLWSMDPSKFEIYVRREHLLEDTRQGLPRNEQDLRKILDIIFVDEIGYCGNGIRQEFFQILIGELLCDDFGACYYEEDSNTQWFLVKGKEDSNLADIQFLGLICGLALYNGVTLHLQFPLALYKKLLDKPVSLDDLLDLTPTIYRSCRWLLKYDGEDIEDCGFDFSVPVELCPNGADIVVNHENKHEYIMKVTDHYLNTSVSNEFESFRKGFFTAMPKTLLRSFQPEELQDVLVGNERYDFKALEEGMEYQNGYHKDHITIRMFWEVFHEMDIQDQKNFLTYLTGTHRIPAYGISKLKMMIYLREEPFADPDMLLPHALTCTNSLGLPMYTNKESMTRMLLGASRFCSGFSSEVHP